MRIVGPERTGPGHAGVHTVDMWFSHRRGRWVVERLDAEGHLLGHVFCAAEEADAAACLEEWLRAHGETHLVTREVRARAARAAGRRDAA